VARRKRSRGIALPWEGRGSWLRQLLAGPRWKVLLLLALAGGLTLTFWDAAEERGRIRATHAAIAEVKRAIGQFRTDMGRCPHSTVELVHPPRSRSHYLRQMPPDGWGRSLYVRCPGHDDPDEADVISAGPSGDFFIDDNLQ